MKIRFARSGYSPTGGAERYLCRLVAELKKRGIPTTLLNDGTWPKESWPGDRIVYLSTGSPSQFANAVEEEKSSSPDSLLFSFERIPSADVFRAGDGIHTAYLQRIAARESRVASWLRKQRKFHKQTRMLERQLFTENPKLHVICNSEMVAAELGKFFNFPDERTTVIYNGFKPKTWTDAERNDARKKIRSKFDIPTDAPLILFVGSGWKRKGADILVSSFKKLAHREAHLILVGKGKLKERTPINVHLPGPIPDPHDYYLAADLFALPTLYDPFSNACLEAAAYQLPVLTTESNGFAEALEKYDGAGETTTNWTDTLGRWLDPKIRESATTPLRQLTQEFSIDANVDQTISLLEKLVIHRNQISRSY